MKRKAVIILAGGALLALSGCDGNSISGGFKDVEGIPPQDPAKVEIFNNVDGFPNVVAICVKEVAFATTTRDLNAILRMPEWDGWCKA